MNNNAASGTVLSGSLNQSKWTLFGAYSDQIEPEPTVPFELQSKCPKIFAERKRFVVMLSAGISEFSSGFIEIPIIKISFPGKLRSDDECGI